MPVVDTVERRAARAAFVERFTERPYHFIRAATPQVLLDEVERVLLGPWPCGRSPTSGRSDYPTRLRCWPGVTAMRGLASGTT